jgi:uncharacterized membrane protein YidH (DUF202 family)
VTSPPDRTGLQPERTALAWQRTAITATVVIVPMVVVNARTGSWLVTVLGALFTLAAGLLVVSVRRRFGQLRGDHAPFSPYDPMLLVALVTGLAAFYGLITALARVLS